MITQLLRHFKKDYPNSGLFKDFFKKVSPRDFAYIFQYEQNQTIAYTLSFCSSKKYIKKALLEFEKAKKENLNELLAKYLKDCTQSSFNIEFAHLIEQTAIKIVDGYYGSFSSRRKSILL